MSAALEASPSAPAVRLLDCAETAKWLTDAGLRSVGGAVTPKTVRRWAHDARIPMWRGPTGYVITEQALNIWLTREQNKAMRACDEKPAAKQTARRGGRR